MDDLDRLAAAAVDGDPLAAAALVRATQSDVWRLCAALGYRQSADDLTQVGLLRQVVGGLPVAEGGTQPPDVGLGGAHQRSRGERVALHGGRHVPLQLVHGPGGSGP